MIRWNEMKDMVKVSWRCILLFLILAQPPAFARWVSFGKWKQEWGKTYVMDGKNPWSKCIYLLWAKFTIKVRIQLSKSKGGWIWLRVLRQCNVNWSDRKTVSAHKGVQVQECEEREVLEHCETSYSLNKGRHCPQALIQVNFHIRSYNSEAARRIRFHTSPWW